MASGAHTGEYQIVLEWYKTHPNTTFTIGDIVNEFGISRKKTANVLGHWTRRNALIRTEERGGFRLRMPEEMREEFKVARPIPKQPKEPEMAFPVLTECAPEMALPELRAILPAKANHRIQFLNASTAIIWNSAQQREFMRQMAIGH